MVFSINTNTAANIALQNLTVTSQQMTQTQLNITTGLKVNGPKDDASTFAIAQSMRGDVSGMSAVQTSLAGGESTVSVAINGGQSISDLVIQMKAKVVAANQAGLDSTSRSALNNDFLALQAQIETIVATASFNGTNLLQSGATNLSVLSTIEGSVINVSAQDMSTTGLGISGLDLTSSANASTALTAINTALTLVNSRLAALGSGAKRIDIQSQFTVKLIDIINEGVGNLVDANMAEESAKLQALQVKQQLGITSLSIANQAPQSILALFK